MIQKASNDFRGFVSTFTRVVNHAIVVIFSLLLPLSLKAQILDDTTQNVYGPSTTEFTNFEQIKFDLNQYFQLDTTIDQLHKFGMVDGHNYLLQNLGALGTAVNPIFFTPPDIIGRTAGFPVYDIYFKKRAHFKYYNTKSPYSKVEAIFAGNNRNIVDVEYSRNINALWNVGFNFKRISAERQIDRQVDNNRQAFSTYYDLYTHYQTKNKKYSLLAQAGRLNHEVAEMGGIDGTPTQFDFGGDPYYLYEDAEVFIQNAKTRENRFNVSLYHQYQLLRKNIQLYHDMEVTTEKNSYQDNNVNLNRAFYDQVLINRDSTDDQFRFREFKNEAGFKGSVSNLFYMFYLKRRSIDFYQKYSTRDNRNHEHSGGVHLRWQFDSLHHLTVNGELMLGGEHLIQGNYQNRFFEASFTRIMSRPSYLQTDYLGNHNAWRNNFSSPHSDNLSAAINIDLKKLKLKPFIKISSIYNHIYFNQQAEPAQLSGFVQIFSPGLTFKWEPVNHLFWESTAIYTTTTGSSRELFRFPELFVNSDLYFQNYLFNSRMLLKLGVGIHYKSPYLALAYHPTIQNFYLQDSFYVPKIQEDNQYVLLNAYANIKIGIIRFFFRMEHLNQASDNGYFISPYFTGQKQTLNFGVNWMFFD